MNHFVPILPCCNIKEQVAFYEALGFEVIAVYTAPGGYAAFKFLNVELHFWATKKLKPEENACMNAFVVEDVDLINQTFTNNLKTNLGKIPRSGFPKITKVRDLKDDRRFTLTDPSGNTFYVMTRNPGNVVEFRSLDNKEYADKFALLYDLIYSKEDVRVATNMLNKMLDVEQELEGHDLIKFLIVKMEILGKNNDIINRITNIINESKIDEVFNNAVTKRINQLDNKE